MAEVNGDPASGEFDFLASSGGVAPPDPHLAVGPDHLVVIDNRQISFFDKDGTNTFREKIKGDDGFWGKQGVLGTVFDPEVLYDPHSGRFMAAAADWPMHTPGLHSFFCLAVSDDSDPNGEWHKYRIHAMDDLDSPNLSVDADVVYLSGDSSAGTHPQDKSLRLVMIDKESVLHGEKPRFTTAWVRNRGSQALPITHDDPAPAQYMIGHYSYTTSRVVLYAITDPLGTPVIHEIIRAVPSYARPEEAPQLGANVRFLTSEARFWSAVYRNGHLWATHHVNRNRVRQRWYEFDMRGWPLSGSDPVLVQSGEIDLGDDVRTFFGSIGVDDKGVMSMVYSRSSPDEYVSMECAWRAPTDPPGTTRPPISIIRSTSSYLDERWGDYSAVVDDPVVPGRFWAIHEYSTHPQRWRSRVAAYMSAIPAESVQRNDAGSTNPSGFSADPPVIGTTWHASVDNTGLDNIAAAVFAYRSPAEVFVPACNGTLLVDVTHPGGELLKLRPKMGTGVVPFSLEVPADDSLMGMRMYAQGVGLGGSGGIHLHNACDLTIGGF